MCIDVSAAVVAPSGRRGFPCHSRQSPQRGANSVPVVGDVGKRRGPEPAGMVFACPATGVEPNMPSWPKTGQLECAVATNGLARRAGDALFNAPRTPRQIAGEVGAMLDTCHGNSYAARNVCG